jgi:hypothetical protein
MSANFDVSQNKDIVINTRALSETLVPSSLPAIGEIVGKANSSVELPPHLVSELFINVAYIFPRYTHSALLDRSLAKEMATSRSSGTFTPICVFPVEAKL